MRTRPQSTSTIKRNAVCFSSPSMESKLIDDKTGPISPMPLISNKGDSCNSSNRKSAKHCFKDKLCLDTTTRSDRVFSAIPSNMDTNFCAAALPSPTAPRTSSLGHFCRHHLCLSTHPIRLPTIHNGVRSSCDTTATIRCLKSWAPLSSLSIMPQETVLTLSCRMQRQQ